MVGSGQVLLVSCPETNTRGCEGREAACISVFRLLSDPAIPITRIGHKANQDPAHSPFLVLWMSWAIIGPSEIPGAAREPPPNAPWTIDRPRAGTTVYGRRTAEWALQRG